MADLTIFGKEPRDMLQTMSRAELTTQIWLRASKDDAFKQALLNDPVSTLKSEFDQAIPDGLNVKILEETSDMVYLVLPKPPQELNPVAVPDQISKVVREALLGSESCNCENQNTC